MKQKIPTAMDLLLAFVATMVRGLHLFEVILGVKHNTESVVQPQLDAAEKAQAEAQEAQDARKTATATRDAIDQDVITLVTLARELFKPKLGKHYTVSWRQAGFVNNNLALARTMEGRITQVKAIELYLGEHPELEVPGVLTAVIAGGLHTNAVAAMTDLGVALSTMRQKTAVRNAAAAALVKRSRELFKELTLLLPANDPRWLEFGFNVPGDISVPSAPEGVTVTAGTAAGEAGLSWNHTVYAERFNLFQQVVGVDAEPVKVETVTAKSAELSGLPSGAHVKFYLTAVNAAGESVPSETVEVVVP